MQLMVATAFEVALGTTVGFIFCDRDKRSNVVDLRIMTMVFLAVQLFLFVLNPQIGIFSVPGPFLSWMAITAGVMAGVRFKYKSSDYVTFQIANTSAAQVCLETLLRTIHQHVVRGVVNPLELEHARFEVHRYLNQMIEGTMGIACIEGRSKLESVKSLWDQYINTAVLIARPGVDSARLQEFEQFGQELLDISLAVVHGARDEIEQAAHYTFNCANIRDKK